MKPKKSAAAALGRRLVYRTAMLPAVLMLGLVLPFLFIRTAFLLLESAALCSSSIGCMTWRLFGGSDASLLEEELRRALLEAEGITNDERRILMEDSKGGGGVMSFKDLVRELRSNKGDITSFAITTKIMIEKMERLVQKAKWQESLYWHLASHGVPNSFHCLSLRLAEEYAVNAVARSPLPPPQHVYRLMHPFFKHVVLLTDNVLSASVVVSSAVEISSHPEELVFHVVTDKKSYTSMHAWFAVNRIRFAVVEVKGLHQYDWPRGMSVAVEEMLEAHVEIRNHKRRRMMEEFEYSKELDYGTDALNPSSVSLLNHLRMYLPQLFPDLDKVLFLDDDVVVQRDLSPLWDVDLEEKVIGAVVDNSWCGDECCKYKNYFNFTDPTIASSLDEHRRGWLYGMNVFDLRQWRKSNVTATYHKWLKLNRDSAYTLWSSGALPPALIAFENLVHRLDSSWHVAGLGRRYFSVENEVLEAAAVVHFSGPAKPWLETSSPEARSLWYRHVNVSNEFVTGCAIAG